MSSYKTFTHYILEKGMSVFSSRVLQDRLKRRATIVEGGHTKCASMVTKILNVPWWVTGALYFLDTDESVLFKY